MKLKVLVLIVVFGICGCSTYHPLTDPSLRKPVGHGPAAGIKVTFLGNTTLLIQDGKTTLLVDGFLSRPNSFKTLFGRLGPSAEIIHAELSATGAGCVDAVLVGHAHHDHALDSTAIADLFGATVVGSESYAKIYEGSHILGSKSRLRTVPRDGNTYVFGNFRVYFTSSAHVAPNSLPQRPIGGEITEPLSLPAHFTKFKCGEVFALHIQHPEGSLAVTTTAGAKSCQLHGRHADVLFLGVGYLSKEPPAQRRFYWDQTVTATKPDLIVPTHWDDFTRKLADGLEPAKGLTGNTRTAMEFVKKEAGYRPVRVLDVRESVWISGGKVFVP